MPANFQWEKTMNKTFTPVLFPACLVACALAMPAAAESTLQVLQPVQAVRVVVDCEVRTLPSLRVIGEMLGQNNSGQIYASRARLMSEVGRACQRPGIERVGLVWQEGALRVAVPKRHVASNKTPPR